MRDAMGRGGRGQRDGIAQRRLCCYRDDSELGQQPARRGCDAGDAGDAGVASVAAANDATANGKVMGQQS